MARGPAGTLPNEPPQRPKKQGREVSPCSGRRRGATTGYGFRERQRSLASGGRRPSRPNSGAAADRGGTGEEPCRALDLRPRGDEASYLAAWDPARSAHRFSLHPATDEEKIRAVTQELRTTVASACDGLGIEWTLRTLTGGPARAIGRLAAESDAEMVIVGTPDRGLGHRVCAALNGSVAACLSHDQEHPVLIVPGRAENRQRASGLRTPGGPARSPPAVLAVVSRFPSTRASADSMADEARAVMWSCPAANGRADSFTPNRRSIRVAASHGEIEHIRP
jgi:nucleotide-binding universal stress UspA family protein